MNFDTLITIGVIIYIIVSIRKAMSHGKKGAGEAKGTTGIGKKLREMAEQIKDEIEKANREMQAQTAPPPPPPVPDGRYEEDDEDEEESLWDAVVDEDADEAEPARVLRQSVLYEVPSAPASRQDRWDSEADTADETDEDNHRNIRAAEPEAVPKPVPSGRRPPSLARQRGRRHLQHAVIWSEILAKPLSLRK
ncbi:hypothetical protein JCM14469_22710 [Desulfatiferula olefinivorans]